MAKEPRVVEAVMVGSATMSNNPARRRLSQRITEAMAEAVATCGEAGLSVSNPDHQDAIRARMLAARERVKQEG